MSQPKLADDPPQPVKNFSIAFLILSLLMIAAQVMNYIITLLPAAQDAVLELGGTTTTVAALQNAYLTIVILVLLIYGVTWFWVRRGRNWSRWIAIILSVGAAVGGVQGLFNALAAGSTDMVGIALSLAQLLAAGWVLALAFRKEVHDHFTTGRPHRPRA